MKVWICRRRSGGALLGEAVFIGGEWEPFDLVVVEVTDQGQRRPTKVARLMRVGTKPIVAELLLPKLVYFKNMGFILSGIEEIQHREGRRGVAQTWQCKLVVPPGAVVRAKLTHNEGVELPRRVLNDRSVRSSIGQLIILGARDDDLGRHAMRAELVRHKSTLGPETLTDCCLDWMSTDTFGLSGFYRNLPHEEQPATLVRQGWLCSIEVPADESGPAPRKPKSDR